VIRLYNDVASSEVAEEYGTLHAALADVLTPSPEASLVDNGMTLALEWRSRWSLTSHGIRRLRQEHAELVTACEGGLRSMLATENALRAVSDMMAIEDATGVAADRMRAAVSKAKGAA
jgi:hypothetical protein